MFFLMGVKLDLSVSLSVWFEKKVLMRVDSFSLMMEAAGSYEKLYTKLHGVVSQRTVLFTDGKSWKPESSRYFLVT
jgi:hypothetical protein